jgi:hypothetical protein
MQLNFNHTWYPERIIRDAEAGLYTASCTHEDGVMACHCRQVALASVSCLLPYQLPCVVLLQCGVGYSSCLSCNVVLPYCNLFLHGINILVILWFLFNLSLTQIFLSSRIWLHVKIKKQKKTLCLCYWLGSRGFVRVQACYTFIRPIRQVGSGRNGVRYHLRCARNSEIELVYFGQLLLLISHIKMYYFL